MTRPGLFVAIGIGIATVPAQAQNDTELIGSGVRAYENLELDAAAGLLRRGLALGPDRLGAGEHTRGLTYLGATEVIRGNRDSARAVFRRLVRFAPRQRLDPLVFPPEVSDVFESVRLTTKVVIVETPPVSTFAPGSSGFRTWAIVSSFSTVLATVQQPDGRDVATIYNGPVSDSLQLEWDARDTAGAMIRSGRYVLAVATTDLEGAVIRIVRVPLDITVVPGDTVPHPLPPDPSTMLPERLGSARGIESLVGGLGVGLAVVGLSSAVAGGTGLSATRFGVGMAAATLGVVGFMRARPGRPLPDNVIANESTRAAWRARVDAVARDNRSRRDNARVSVRAGTPQIIERDR